MPSWARRLSSCQLELFEGDATSDTLETGPDLGGALTQWHIMTTLLPR